MSMFFSNIFSFMSGKVHKLKYLCCSCSNAGSLLALFVSGELLLVVAKVPHEFEEKINDVALCRVVCHPGKLS